MTRVCPLSFGASFHHKQNMKKYHFEEFWFLIFKDSNIFEDVEDVDVHKSPACVLKVGHDLTRSPRGIRRGWQMPKQDLADLLTHPFRIIIRYLTSFCFFNTERNFEKLLRKRPFSVKRSILPFWNYGFEKWLSKTPRSQTVFYMRGLTTGNITFFKVSLILI